VRVLIVERRTADTRIHSNGLAAEGIARYGARSGAEAVDGSLNGHCDLVLLDLVLAGLKWARGARAASHERRGLPVIIVSARGDLNTKLRAFELGAKDYLVKPFSPLVDVCIRRLRRKLGPTTPIETLRHAGYRLATD
jgi:DNA-binding response OmpR family regulator